MSKEQTPIEEWSTEEHIKSLLVLRGFSKEYILNNRGLIGAIIEDMEQYAQAKVLEALKGRGNTYSGFVSINDADELLGVIRKHITDHAKFINNQDDSEEEILTAVDSLIKTKLDKALSNTVSLKELEEEVTKAIIKNDKTWFNSVNGSKYSEIEEEITVSQAKEYFKSEVLHKYKNK